MRESGHISAGKNNFKLGKVSAFTLVETLVAVTLFSILVVGLASVFSSGMKLWGNLRNADAGAGGVFLSLEKISRELRQSVDFDKIGYEGTQTSISFPVLDSDRILKVTYFLDQADTIVRQQSDYSDIFAERDLSSEKNVIGVQELSLRYLYYDSKENAFTWDDKWDKTRGTFTALRIRLKTNEKEYEKTVFLPVS